MSLAESFSSAYAVCVSADQRAVAGVAVDVALQRVVAKNHISVLSVPVGNLNADHCAAEISQPCDCTALVGEREQPALVASEKTKFCLRNAH